MMFRKNLLDALTWAALIILVTGTITFVGNIFWTNIQLHIRNYELRETNARLRETNMKLQSVGSSLREHQTRDVQ